MSTLDDDDRACRCHPIPKVNTLSTECTSRTRTHELRFIRVHAPRAHTYVRTYTQVEALKGKMSVADLKYKDKVKRLEENFEAKARDNDDLKELLDRQRVDVDRWKQREADMKNQVCSLVRSLARSLARFVRSFVRTLVRLSARPRALRGLMMVHNTDSVVH